MRDEQRFDRLVAARFSSDAIEDLRDIARESGRSFSAVLRDAGDYYRTRRGSLSSDVMAGAD